VKTRGVSDTPTLMDNQPITGALLRRLYAVSTIRVKCIIALLTGSGVRREVLGNHEGSDGLRLGGRPGAGAF